MLRKTQRSFLRKADGSTMRIKRDTWWLLGFIPLYSRDTITSASNF